MERLVWLHAGDSDHAMAMAIRVLCQCCLACDGLLCQISRPGDMDRVLDETIPIPSLINKEGIVIFECGRTW